MDGSNVTMKKSGFDLALANCDLLLYKYTEGENAKMDLLFILAELFDGEYNNNPGEPIRYKHALIGFIIF